MNDPVEFGKAIAARVKDFVTAATAELATKLADLEQRVESIPAGKDGRDGIDGKDGAPGVDGKDGAPGERGPPGETGVGEPGPQGERGEPGPQGAPGAAGEAGKSITVDEVRDVLEAVSAKWALDFERRAAETLQRAIDRIPAPKDGRDGFGFDDMSVEFDGERRVALIFTRGDQRKEFSFDLPTVIDRGVYREGQQYAKGDGVTWGGQFFIAQRETTAKPMAPGVDDWRLSVKKGRDGKDFR